MTALLQVIFLLGNPPLWSPDLPFLPIYNSSPDQTYLWKTPNPRHLIPHPTTAWKKKILFASRMNLQILMAHKVHTIRYLSSHPVSAGAIFSLNWYAPSFPSTHTHKVTWDLWKGWAYSCLRVFAQAVSIASRYLSNSSSSLRHLLQGRLPSQSRPDQILDITHI